MVERREYESYIKSRVEKLLRKSENNEVSSQRKREIEWLLLDQIRMFANSELSEEKFMDSILNEIKDVTYFNAEEDYYEDNITLIKQTIIKVYKNIIREHSNDPSKIWLDNQIAIILRSLKGISIDSQQTIAMFIRDIIKHFTIEYSNSPHKMETEKNDLLLMIEDIVNNSSFKTEKELEELIIMGISSKYMGIFTLKEIESIIGVVS